MTNKDDSKRKTYSSEYKNTQEGCSYFKSWPILPTWASERERENWGNRIEIKEWDGPYLDGNDQEVQVYRADQGWKGNDLVHSPSAPVRVLEYRVKYPLNQSFGTGTKLIGIVVFTPKSESHKGYCHGGSMCSVMDDIIGWTGFCASGQCVPWSGFTVQVNTNLLKPVKVGQILRIDCVIERIERRKVYVSALLFDPETISEACDGIHAKAEGLVILNRGILSSE